MTNLNTQNLGIFVSSSDRFDHLFGLAQAAKDKGVMVRVFLTADGVTAAQDERFPILAQSAEVGICRASLKAYGIDPEILGVRPENISNQSWHSRMLDLSDRYLSF